MGGACPHQWSYRLLPAVLLCRRGSGHQKGQSRRHQPHPGEPPEVQRVQLPSVRPQQQRAGVKHGGGGGADVLGHTQHHATKLYSGDLQLYGIACCNNIEICRCQIQFDLHLLAFDWI